MSAFGTSRHPPQRNKNGRYRGKNGHRLELACGASVAIDPACVKTHTSEKYRKYNSLRRYRAVCAQYDLSLIMRNRFEIFLRA